MRTIELDRLSLADGMTVLDLGCGTGRHLHALYFAADMVCIGVDLSPADLGKTRDGFDSLPDLSGDRGQAYGLASADALQLPFAAQTFDRIICSEVLEHIPDFETALDEIARVLKPGGQLAISVPRAWPEQICWWLSEEYHNTPGGHVRIFKAKALRQAVQMRKFSYRAKHYAHGLHAPYWWLKCLFWQRRDDHPLIKAWQKMLEWEILVNPVWLRPFSRLADWAMGKSVVLYFDKPEP
ncbi:SAM-dependent methyltransferase [hydrothermal vent metagenome]|uniref:SAM-dependent methyltransferase n=1 Tax=hydrothermal vent metagenome TaxID=652676 RepID=A0A3B0SC04_9ZZZZ